MSRIRTGTASALALALALTFAPAAMAGTVAESLSINSVLNVSGIPATINYGAMDQLTTSATQTFTVNVTSNAPYVFKLSGSDFTGPATIAKTAREAQIGLAANVTMNAPAGWTNFGNAAYNGTNPVVTGNTGASNFNVDLRVTVPAAAPGAYTGTLTYTVSAL